MRETDRHLARLAAVDPGTQACCSRTEQAAMLAAILAQPSGRAAVRVRRRRRLRSLVLFPAAIVVCVIVLFLRPTDSARVGPTGLADARAAVAPRSGIVYLATTREDRDADGRLLFVTSERDWASGRIKRVVTRRSMSGTKAQESEAVAHRATVRSYDPTRNVITTIRGGVPPLFCVLDELQAALRDPAIVGAGRIRYEGRPATRYVLRRPGLTLTYLVDPQSSRPLFVRVDTRDARGRLRQVTTYRVTSYRRLTYDPRLLRLNAPRDARREGG